MHPRLQRKFYGWTPSPIRLERVPEHEEDLNECPKCHGTDLEFEVGRARSANGRSKAHGGKIGYRCQECRHLNPMKLEKLNP